MTVTLTHLCMRCSRSTRKGPVVPSRVFVGVFVGKHPGTVTEHEFPGAWDMLAPPGGTRGAMLAKETLAKRVQAPKL